MTATNQLRFAILARVSTEGQEKEGTSLEVQQKTLRECVERLNGTVVKEYIGQESAMGTKERPIFDELLADCSRNLFDAVMVLDLSRWSRNPEKSRYGLAVLKKHGIKLFIQTTEYNLSNPETDLIVGGLKELEILKMKFDLIMGNPPYNISSGGSNGTAGNTTFYKRFRILALEYLTPGGNLSFVCPKGIIKDLYASPNQVDTIDLMVDEDFWRFNTLYFIERKIPKCGDPKFKHSTIAGSIIDKMVARVFNEWRFTEYSRNKKTIEPVYALVDLKNGGNYGMTDSALPPAPRFWCEKLSSSNYVAYDGYADPGISGYVECSSLAGAERLKMFLKVSKLPHFFQRKMKVKSLEKDFFRFSRRFDVSKIKTGHEYPVEYGLTEEEIEYIESQVR